jgi:hypothetical protein
MRKLVVLLLLLGIGLPLFAANAVSVEQLEQLLATAHDKKCSGCSAAIESTTDSTIQHSQISALANSITWPQGPASADIARRYVGIP